MPRIDDFKKKEYRAWDKDLLKKLQINSEAPKSKKKRKNEEKKEGKEKKMEKIEEIEGKISNNEGSIRVQQGCNKGAIRVQQGCNKGAIRVHKNHSKGSIRVQQGCNKGSIRVQNKGAIRVQQGCKLPLKKIAEQIKKLTGNEKKLFFYIVELCDIRSALTTGEISSKAISIAINTTRNGLETALKRLQRKGFIKREKGKKGKGGMLVFSLSENIKTEALKHFYNENIFQEILDNKGSIRVQNDDSIRVQLGFKSPPYSSSSILNTTTTNYKNELQKNLDIACLEKIGFNEDHLKQLFTIKNLTPEIIQSSINHFAYDLEHNEKQKEIKKSALAYFMGIMKRNGCYNSPDNYESPQEKAMREWVEKEEKQKRLREEQRLKIFNLAFDKWLDLLTEEEAKKLFSENSSCRLRFKGKNDGGLTRSVLCKHYKENIWPHERKALGLESFWDHFNEDKTS